MPDRAPYRQFLSRAEDLVTTEADFGGIRSAVALERERRILPSQERTTHLRYAVASTDTPTPLTEIKCVGGAILTAAGVSDAEMDLMTDKQRLEAKRDFVQTVLVPAGQEYVDELVRRFRIATLRHLERSFAHIPVALARQGVVRAIMSQFELADAAYHWLSKDGDKWLRAKGDNTDRERRTTGLSWTHASGQRVLMLGEHDPASEDLCYVYVFACHYQAVGASVHLEQLPCIAFGVVAAGLDPTGFCEHWKTARSALTRIRDAFTKNDAAPSTFFVANGIAKSMADEIWRDLENGVLTNAANLTKADQVSLLARWLIGL